MNTPFPISSSRPPRFCTVPSPAPSHPRPSRPSLSHRGASAPFLPLPLLSLFTFLFSLFTLVFPAAQAAPSSLVEWDIQPRILNLGETATATITFHGPDAPGGLSLPDTDGLSIQNAGVTRQNINGARSVLFTYRIFPRRAGDFTLGPYHLDAEGNLPSADLDAITLRVRAPDPDAPKTEMLFARIESTIPSPYVQQTFDLILRVYSLPTVELARDIRLVGGFPESGFVQGPFEELAATREETSGQIYTVRRFRARFRALTAGDFDLTPTLQVGVVDRAAQNARRRNSPFGSGFFDDPFFNPPVATPVALSAPPLTLRVRPLPAVDRPATFTGAVGQYRFEADVRPRELKVGEPLTVTLRVTGRGNIATVRPPSYTDTPDYKTYEARQSGDSPDPAADTGSKTFEQVVIPRAETLTALPALTFDYFDPDADSYLTATAGPFPLTVHPSDTPSSALLVQIPDAATPDRPRALVLGTDIIYLQPSPTHWLNPDASPLLPVIGYTTAFALPPLILLALHLTTRRRHRLASDVAFARRLQAPRVARAALRRAEAAARAPTPDPRSVFEPLSDAATAYFAHRLNLPPGAATPSALLTVLEKSSLPPDDLARWREFFTLSDAIRYGASPALTPTDLQTWTQTLATLLRQAERTRLP